VFMCICLCVYIFLQNGFWIFPYHGNSYENSTVFHQIPWKPEIFFIASVWKYFRSAWLTFLCYFHFINCIREECAVWESCSVSLWCLTWRWSVYYWWPLMEHSNFHFRVADCPFWP
jgi:hypothetical protein